MYACTYTEFTLIIMISHKHSHITIHTLFFNAVDLLSKFNETLVMATTTDSSIEVSCEMRAFIRPDSSFIWEGPDGHRITSGRKYRITFSNGSNDAAADGSHALVPSRVSTLTVHDPEKSDQGVYTCSVAGTNKTIELMIMVKDGDIQTDPATTTLQLGMYTAEESLSRGESSVYKYTSYTALMLAIVTSAGVLLSLNI